MIYDVIRKSSVDKADISHGTQCTPEGNKQPLTSLSVNVSVESNEPNS